MRKNFDQKLSTLNIWLIEMGSLVEETITIALKTVTQHNDLLWDRMITLQEEIKQKNQDIEALCLKLLLQQQPVAKDLRLISTALKMITDLKRIGDQGVDIAEISLTMEENKFLEQVPILKMARGVTTMVTESIDAFVKGDLSLGEKVIKADDEIDDLFEEVKEKLIHLLIKDNTQGKTALDLLMIAKYLERIGDHGVNIATWVVASLRNQANNRVGE